MPKNKHQPISYERFIELENANAETVTDFVHDIIKMLARGDAPGSISGRMLDFLEEFKEDDERQMALAVIFLKAVAIGRELGPKEETPEPEEPKKKKSGNGRLKN